MLAVESPLSLNATLSFAARDSTCQIQGSPGSPGSTRGHQSSRVVMPSMRLRAVQGSRAKEVCGVQVQAPSTEYRVQSKESSSCSVEYSTVDGKRTACRGSVPAVAYFGKQPMNQNHTLTCIRPLQAVTYPVPPDASPRRIPSPA